MSLAQITSELRTTLKLFGAAVGIICVVFVVYMGASYIIKLNTPPPPPDQKFGKLPEVLFPAQNPVKAEFRVNTIDGTLPSFPDRMTIYKTKLADPSLGALQTTKQKAASAGFDQNETKISDSLYQWTDEKGRILQMDIYTNNFKLSSNFLASPPIPFSTEIDKKMAVENVYSFLNSLGFELDDIDPELSQVSFLKLENGNIAPVDNQNDANLISVDLFQKKLDEKPIFYPEGLNKSTMNFLLQNNNIVDADFTNYPPDNSDSATYPIISSSEALEKLKNGNAFIIENENNSSVIDITNVESGYYIGNEIQQYFLPIAVFKGKNFLAYVSLLKN